MITSGKLVTSKEFLILRKTLSCVPSKMNYLEIWPKEENEVTFCGRVMVDQIKSGSHPSNGVALIFEFFW